MRFFRGCDVCILINGDAMAKQVRYCPTCDAYICDHCWANPARRAAAMAKRAKGKFGRTIKKLFGVA